MPSVQSQHKGNHKGGRPKAAPPLWRRPKAASFVLALNTGRILLLRRKTCALLRAKTSALLRNKTFAVLRARARALLRARAKESAFNHLHKGGRPSAAPFCGFLCVGSEHWAYLTVETQDMCLAESQDIRLVGTQDMCCVES